MATCWCPDQISQFKYFIKCNKYLRPYFVPIQNISLAVLEDSLDTKCDFFDLKDDFILGLQVHQLQEWRVSVALESVIFICKTSKLAFSEKGRVSNSFAVKQTSENI